MKIIRETKDLDFSIFRNENCGTWLLNMHLDIDKTRLVPEFVESPL